MDASETLGWLGAKPWGGCQLNPGVAGRERNPAVKAKSWGEWERNPGVLGRERDPGVIASETMG